MQRQNGSAVIYTGLCRSIERPSWRAHRLDYSTRRPAHRVAATPVNPTTRILFCVHRHLVTNSIRHCGMGRGWLRAAIRALEELYPTKLAEVVPAHLTKHELTYGPRSPYLASA